LIYKLNHFHQLNRFIRKSLKKGEIEMEKMNKKSSAIGGVVFVGCMFIGMGLGMYYDNIVIGLMIGMGAGFIAMAVAWALLMDK